MPTTFNWIYLGRSATMMDVTEGDATAERAEQLEGTVWGGSASPLYNNIASATTIDNGGTAGVLDTNNNATTDQISTTVAGSPVTLIYDAVSTYTVTLTYADGTTVQTSAVIVQMTNGDLFLAPPITGGTANAALTNKPITSLRLDDATGFSNTNFGADRMQTGWDNGWIDGTTGNDLIDGTYTEPLANGTDRVDGGDGVSNGGGGWNDDRIRAGAGNDTVRAGAGNDSVMGEAGDDSLEGGAGNDTLDGGIGNDILLGEAGSDQLYGGAGNDSLFGGADNDSLYGGDGSDTLAGGAGADSLTGGGGLDYADYSASGSGVTVDLGSGTGLGGDAQGDVYDGIDGIIGSAYGDSLSGYDPMGSAADPYTNIFYGGAGNDTLDGRGGDDQLYGGTGDDVLIGGTGNDLVDGGDGADRFVLSGANFGSDTITGGEGGTDQDSIDATGTSGNTTVTYTGAEAGSLTSSGGGSAGFSQIEAIQTGAGADSINAGANTANSSYSTGAGDDTVQGGSGNETLSGGDGADSLHGGGGDDRIFGGSGNDSMDGGTGADSLDGGIGNDTLHGGTGNDTLLGDAGEDHLYGGAGVDSLYGGTGNDWLYGGDDADRLEGGDGGDWLEGGAGNDSLDGGAGNDTLLAGTGTDTLTGGAGIDHFDVNGSTNALITDFGTGNTGGTDDGNAANNDYVDLSAYYNETTLAQWNAAHPGNTYGNPLAWMRADQADGVLQGANGLRIQNNGNAVDAAQLGAETTGVICFATGTRILTPRGEVAVQDLRPGDAVFTLDAGAQTLRWIGARHLDADALARAPHLRPIRIRAGALGRGLPAADLVVSPQHRLLLRSRIVERMTGADETLVAAKHLLGLDGVAVADDLTEVGYYHLLLDSHQVIFAEGAPAETLLVGAMARQWLPPAALAEVLEILPELAATLPEPARALMGGRMARTLTQRHLKNHLPLLEDGPALPQMAA